MTLPTEERDLTATGQARAAPEPECGTPAGGTSAPEVTLLEALQQTFSEIAPELQPLVAELRTTARDGEMGLLLERCHRRGYIPRDPALAAPELAAARAARAPAVLRDMAEGSVLKSWIVVPVHGAAFPVPFELILGVSRDAARVDAAELAHVAERATPISACRPDATGLSHRVRPDHTFKLLAEAVPVAILVTDTEGYVIAVNSNFRFVFAQHRPLCRGASIETLLVPEQARFFRRVLDDTLESGGCVEAELPRLRRELGALDFTVSTTLFQQREGTALVIFVLREISTGLELSRLQERERHQEYLFQAFVHDVRTPLSAVANGIEFLQSVLPGLVRSAPGIDCEEVQEVLRIVQYSSHQIDRLLGDVSDFLEVESGVRPPRLEVFPLAEAVGAVVDVHRLRAIPHRLSVTVVEDALVHLDRGRVARAIDNLVSNAIKYSPNGGEVRLAIGPAPEQDSIQVEVSDQGVGIAPEYLDKIWEPFYRLHSDGTREAEGCGLGLSIVRRIIESQGGSIAVESTLGRGTTFRVLLPRLPESSHAAFGQATPK